MSQSEILQMLLARFEGRALISACEAANQIKPGMSETATRCSIYRNSFPLPVHKILGENMCRTADLAAFLSDPTIAFTKAEEPGKRRPGRPPKVLQA